MVSITTYYCTPAQVGERLGLAWDPAETLSSNATETTLKVTLATTGRKYTTGNSLRVLNDDGVTEDVTVSGISYGATEITLTTGSMTNYADYTTANNTTAQIKSPFTALTNPTKSVVEDMINDAEAEINTYCRRSWSDMSSYSGYLNWSPRRVYFHGEPYSWYKIRLPYPDPVLPLSSSDGDSLKIWTGGAETEWVDVKTEGRTNDFWCDRKGYLYINSERPFPSENAIFITYRHGDTTVPNDIRKACIYITMGDFLDANRYNQSALTGNTEGEAVPFTQSTTSYRNKAYTLLKKHKQIRTY